MKTSAPAVAILGFPLLAKAIEAAGYRTVRGSGDEDPTELMEACRSAKSAGQPYVLIVDASRLDDQDAAEWAAFQADARVRVLVLTGSESAPEIPSKARTLALPATVDEIMRVFGAPACGLEAGTWVVFEDGSVPSTEPDEWAWPPVTPQAPSEAPQAPLEPRPVPTPPVAPQAPSEAPQALLESRPVPTPPVAHLSAQPIRTPPGAPLASVLIAFAGKGGVGKCLTGDSLILDVNTGLLRRLDSVASDPAFRWITTPDIENGSLTIAPIAAKIYSGVKPVSTVTLRSGREVTTTPHHPFLTPDGWMRADELEPGSLVVVAGFAPAPEVPGAGPDPELLGARVRQGIRHGAPSIPDAAFTLAQPELASFLTAILGDLDGGGTIHIPSVGVARSLQHLLLRLRRRSVLLRQEGTNGAWLTPCEVGHQDLDHDVVVSVTPVSPRPVWDLTVEETHCFVANDVVVHNTTSALALGQRAVNGGLRRVVVVDANRGQGDLRKYLRVGQVSLPSVYDAAVTGDPRRAISTPAALNAVRDPALPDLSVAVALAPNDGQADPGVVTAMAYRDVIDTARTVADLVIVDTQIIEAWDTSGLIDNLITPLLVEGAWGLALSDASMPGFDNLIRRLTKLSNAGVDPSRIMFALNRVPSDAAIGEAAMRQVVSRFATFVGSVPESSELASAFATGRIPDEPSLVVVLDAVLHRVTGLSEFAPRPTEPGRAGRRGLLGRLTRGGR